MSLIKVSGGGGFVQCKEKALGDTAHLISAKLSRLQQHMEGKGIFSPLRKSSILCSLRGWVGV